MVKRHHDFDSDDTLISSSEAGSSSTAVMSSSSSSASSSTETSSSPSNSEPGSPSEQKPLERPTQLPTAPSTVLHTTAGNGRPRGNRAGLLLLGMADPHAPTPRLGNARPGPARVLFPRTAVSAEAARVALYEEVRRNQARALDFEVTGVSRNGIDFQSVQPVSYDEVLRTGNLPKRLRLSDLPDQQVASSSTPTATSEEQGPTRSTTAAPPEQQGPTPR